MLQHIFKNVRFGLFMHQKQKNHYEVLGLSSKANSTEIKKKYYQLAKYYHPDVNKSSDAEKTFHQISIAYQTLSDEAKRKEYDSENKFNTKTFYQQSQTQERNSKKQRPTFNEEQPEPFTNFDPFFKKNRKNLKPKRGADININIEITLKESINGIKKQVQFTREENCENCRQKEHPLCFSCGGKGTIFNRSKRQKEECQKCNGKGYVNECIVCKGKGTILRDVKEPLYIGKNTHHKTILRVQGNGHHGFKHSNGDLYVTVIVKESQKFKVDGNNVYSEHQLDYITAVFGGNTTIETVYGEKQVKVEAGTQSGQEIRLFNEGLTSAYSKRKGDHIITFRIRIPQTLTVRQKELFGQLQSY